jgi:ferredoxin
MATLINELCISCGACEPVCPGDGIRKGDGIFVIDPARCTECVGYHAKQQCEAVCPIDQCCVPDPDRVETEAVLFERALKLASDDDDVQPTLTGSTSHFRTSSLPWWRRLMLSV